MAIPQAPDPVQDDSGRLARARVPSESECLQRLPGHVVHDDVRVTGDRMGPEIRTDIPNDRRILQMDEDGDLPLGPSIQFGDTQELHGVEATVALLLEHDAKPPPAPPPPP